MRRRVQRVPEERHDRVALELVDHAALLHELGRLIGQVAVEQEDDLLRLERFRDRREAGDVAEEDRELRAAATEL